MPNSAKEKKQTVTTTETAFAIIELLKEANGARITEAANELGLVKSTLHRHLTTLEKLNYVVKEGDTYYPSLQFLNIGTYAQRRRKGFDLIEPKVQELANETEERAHFIIEEHGMGVYVYREVGKHAIRTDRGIGTQIPLHATASGKVILAHLPEERVREIADLVGLNSQTSNTITSLGSLLDEFQTIREKDIAFNHSENIEGERAVASPIRDEHGQIIGALNVVGPAHRLKGKWFKEQIPDLLRGAANELELNIAHS